MCELNRMKKVDVEAIRAVMDPEASCFFTFWFFEEPLFSIDFDFHNYSLSSGQITVKESYCLTQLNNALLTDGGSRSRNGYWGYGLVPPSVFIKEPYYNFRSLDTGG